MTEPATPPQDDKDWTFVITDGCQACAFTPPAAPQVAARLSDAIARWRVVLAKPEATTRPAPDVWSPLEYSAHVRDVFRTFEGRFQRMLTEDDPGFENWDQDATAIAERYWEQDPVVVVRELAFAGDRVVDLLDDVRDAQWERPGRRSNGSQFTVATLAVYLLHDVEHHLHDVTG